MPSKTEGDVRFIQVAICILMSLKSSTVIPFSLSAACTTSTSSGSSSCLLKWRKKGIEEEDQHQKDKRQNQKKKSIFRGRIKTPRVTSEWKSRNLLPFRQSEDRVALRGCLTQEDADDSLACRLLPLRLLLLSYFRFPEAFPLPALVGRLFGFYGRAGEGRPQHERGA